MFDPCVAVQEEIGELEKRGFSQRLYQLKLYLWANGCPGAQAPRHDQDWANDSTGFPPLSYTSPGNPDDRVPPAF